MGINSRKSILFVNVTDAVTEAGTDITIDNFVPIVCLTNNSFEGTTSPIDSTSKCSPNGFTESIDGNKSWTISGEGLAYAKAVGETVKNHNDLFKLWKAGTAVWWLIADKESPEASLTIRYGVGRIDSSSDQFPDNDTQKFNVSITGIGEAFDQDDLAPSAP